MKPSSIKDIAQKVGVSTTTVSFVLNGKGRQKRISEKLEKEIIAVAQQLQYRPNPMARSLRTGKTQTLGLIVEDIANPFFANLARIVEIEADLFGYTVMFCSTDNKDEKGAGLIDILKYRQMDGFLITPSAGMKKEIQQLRDENRAFVLIDRFFPDVETSFVSVDNHKGGSDAAAYLIDVHCRRLAMVTTVSDQVQMENRRIGFVEMIQKHQLPFSAEQVLRLPFDIAETNAVSRISEFITSIKPDGIFFTTNYLGVYGLESVRSLGLQMPGEIRMVCFDDNDLFRLGSPGVTVVSQPTDLIGKTAVSILMRQLSGERTMIKPEQIVLEPTLLRRET